MLQKAEVEHQAIREGFLEEWARNGIIRAWPTALTPCVAQHQHLPSLGPVASSTRGDTAREGNHHAWWGRPPASPRAPRCDWLRSCMRQSSVSTGPGPSFTHRDLEVAKTLPGAQLPTHRPARVSLATQPHTWLPVPPGCCADRPARQGHPPVLSARGTTWTGAAPPQTGKLSLPLSPPRVEPIRSPPCWRGLCPWCPTDSFWTRGLTWPRRPP